LLILYRELCIKSQSG